MLLLATMSKLSKLSKHRWVRSAPLLALLATCAAAFRHSVSAAAVVALGPADALAHGGGGHGPSEAFTTWTLDPIVLALLALTAWGYHRGQSSLRTRAGSRGIPAWRVRCHWAGLATLFVALVSPVDGIGESLFSGHMVQHLLLTMIAAPLLVLGDTGTALLWALPLRGRRGVGRVLRAPAVRAAWNALSHPMVAWGLHATALVAWHVPSLYELAVVHEGIHALEHASFFITALLFWWVVAAPRARQRLSFGPTLLYLFTATVASAILGAGISVADTPWYLVHARSATLWGLTPLEDQHLAGLIMWVPAGLVYLAALAPIVGNALAERDSSRRLTAHP